jgi:hypothetical protein
MWRNGTRTKTKPAVAVAALALAATMLAPPQVAGAQTWPAPQSQCTYDPVTGIVVGWAEAPGAITVSLTCHVWSGLWHAHFGGTGAGSTSYVFGRVVVPGPARTCAEVSAVYLTGSWHKSCPAH